MYGYPHILAIVLALTAVSLKLDFSLRIFCRFGSDSSSSLLLEVLSLFSVKSSTYTNTLPSKAAEKSSECCVLQTLDRLSVFWRLIDNISWLNIVPGSPVLIAVYSWRAWWAPFRSHATYVLVNMYALSLISSKLSSVGDLIPNPVAVPLSNLMATWFILSACCKVLYYSKPQGYVEYLGYIIHCSTPTTKLECWNRWHFFMLLVDSLENYKKLACPITAFKYCWCFPNRYPHYIKVIALYSYLYSIIYLLDDVKYPSQETRVSMGIVFYVIICWFSSCVYLGTSWFGDTGQYYYPIQVHCISPPP